MSAGGTSIRKTYVAHTFAAEMARREKIDLQACLKEGAVLADGLAHMHQAGLIHRDVKPSNVIFVEGEVRLADIGLVAMSGQRSFVGTEGFVPLEGPGTPAADIYSLGMVLYELGTGKDRLDFSRCADESRGRSGSRAVDALEQGDLQGLRHAGEGPVRERQ